MQPTDAREATPRARITPNFPSAEPTADGPAPIAAAPNAPASPTSVARRSFVPPAEVREDGFVRTEIDRPTVGEARIRGRGR